MKNTNNNKIFIKSKTIELKQKKINKREIK